MRYLLLWIGVAVTVMTAPAMAQFVYVDVNGDGMCSAADVITESTTFIDIWFDTAHNADGSPAQCAVDPGSPLTFFSYEFILHNSGVPGSVVYGSYVNHMTEFTVQFGTSQDASDIHTGFGGTVPLAPGRYRVGTLGISVAPGASPVIGPARSSPLDPVYFTAFGSECFGNDFDNTIKLGTDFQDACSTTSSVNQPPVVTAPASATGTAGTLITFVVTAADPDGDPIESLTAAPLPTGASFTANATKTSGTFAWTPSMAQVDSFDVVISAKSACRGDPLSGPVVCDTGTATVSVVVIPSGQPPVVTAPPQVEGTAGSLLVFAVSASDPDGDPIEYLTAAPLPTGASFSTNPTKSSGTFAWTPSTAQVGTFSVTISAKSACRGDPLSGPVVCDTGTATVTLLVRPGDRAPVVTAPAAASGTEMSLVTFTVAASDPDGDPITRLNAGLPDGATFMVNGSMTSGTFSWTPSFTQAGIYPVWFAAVNALSDTTVTEITVANADRAPVVTAPETWSGMEGELLVFEVGAIDWDGEPISTLTAAPLPSGATFVSDSLNTSGIFRWTPGPGQAGEYDVVFVAANALFGADTTRIVVLSPDHPPVVTAPATVSGDEGKLINFRVNAADPDGDPITYLSAGPLPAGATFAASDQKTSGTFSWTPSFLQAGTYHVWFTAANALFDSTMTQLTVANVDRAPVVTAPTTWAGDEGVPLAFPVTANDPDGEGIATLAAAPLPAGATFATDPMNSGGAFIWTPNSSQAGHYDVTFTASNALTGSATTRISIAENRPPTVTAPSSVSGFEGQPLSFVALAADPDNEPIDSLWAAPLPPGAGFAVNGTNSSGTFSWTPDFGRAGSYPVVVWAQNTLSDSATVWVQVFETNVPPILMGPDSLQTSEGTPVSFTVNAIDPNGDRVTISAVNLPVGATFAAAGESTGVFRWTPGYGQAGVYQVQFIGRDEGGLQSEPLVVTVTVGNVNRPPVAEAGGPYLGTVNMQVLFYGNASYDPDGDPLTYLWSFGDGAWGTGAVAAHTYTAPGYYWILLSVSDGSLWSSDSTSAAIQTLLPARAFTAGGNDKIRLGSGKASWCVQIEPVDGSYLNTRVLTSTIVMRYSGLQIPAVPGKVTIGADKDANGIEELTVCFAKTDLRTLFDSLPKGSSTVTVEFEGELQAGGRFRATLPVIVISRDATLSASLAPNPLNPNGILTFTTSQEGPARVTMFDLQGRLLRVLLDEPYLAAGYHDLPIDGRTASGVALASGVYFYRIETREGTLAGRFAVMK